MHKRFLVASSDESITEWAPAVVAANDANAAVRKYLQIVYSKDDVFRDTVLDRSPNMSFSEKFFISTSEEMRLLDRTGVVATAKDKVQTRVREFFIKSPNLGENFLRYMEGGDANEVTDEVFEFIAESDHDGLIALDLDALLHL